jgi:hypothetical protein
MYPIWQDGGVSAVSEAIVKEVNYPNQHERRRCTSPIKPTSAMPEASVIHCRKLNNYQCNPQTSNGTPQVLSNYEFMNNPPLL